MTAETRTEAASPPSRDLERVPWTIRDILGGFGFLVLSVLTILASVEAVESVRDETSGGDTIAAAGLSIVVALLLVAGLAKLTRVSVPSSIAIVLGGSAVASAVALLGDVSLADGESSVLGLPAAVFFIALVESMLLVSGLLYTRWKYGVPLRSLGLVRVTGIRPFGVALIYWMAALVAIGAWAVSMQVIGADRFLFPDTADEALDLAGGSVPLAILLVGAWGPFGEELFFRGFVLSGLRNRFSTRVAVLLSSAVFGAIHIAPGAIIPTFFLGLAFALIYVRTRSIWPAVFAHSVQNTLAIVAAATNLA